MKRIILLLILILFTGAIQSQVYEICIENAELVNQNTFEFDVCISGVSNPFELTSYQCALTYNSNITNGGTLSFSYILGSTTINSIPNYGIGINVTNGIKKLTFASMPGSDIIDTLKKKIGRFRLTNTLPFGEHLREIISLKWNFEGNITTILTGENFNNITNPASHVSSLNGLSFLTINNALSSGIPEANHGPEKTHDGLGYYNGDPDSRWVVEAVPQWIKYDLGSQKTVSLTRFSFYNFNAGRKYIYSVYLSTDNNNWTEVVTNDTSDTIEYTENKFEPCQARYVRLSVISNNQNNWACVWEAEIWGGDNSIIPVELSSFNGHVEKDKVILEWTTTSELNNRGFQIERSKDKENFEKLYFVSGQGTLADIHNYTYTDKGLSRGRYTYRLQQINLDGSYTYSEPLELEINNTVTQSQLYQNYPNPFNPVTNIKFSLPYPEEVRIDVFNILGENVTTLLNEGMVEGYHIITFNAGHLPSGTYIYRIQAESFTKAMSMVLIK